MSRIQLFRVGLWLPFWMVSLSPLRADWRDDVGYTQLVTELTAAGILVPNGSGIGVAMAEAPSAMTEGPPATVTYMPNTAGAEFSGKTVTAGTAGSVGTSGHATGVAEIFYGNSLSIAPGITQATVYEANDWINVGTGLSGGLQPISHSTFKIINHSWVARRPSPLPDNFDAAIVNVSQRIDHLANRDNLLIIAGTDNGGALPELVSTSYNAISVGRSDGVHAAGTTTKYGPGRQRPDIVAPAGSTSNATPMVSSAAALLHDYADNSAATAGATRAETMRAILMAGATKNEFAGWTRTSTQPLDVVYGAGQLNVRNSYRIIEGGEQEGSIIVPTTPVGLFGYDNVTTADFAGLERNYLFSVPTGQTFDELSIFLQWHVDVRDADPTAGFSPLVDLTPGPTSDLANLDLFFYDESGTELDSSVSLVDNFEHLYFQNLTAGSYRLRVTGNRADDFGLAWRSVISVPEPGGWAMIFLFLTGGWLTAGKRFRWRFKSDVSAENPERSKTISRAGPSNAPVVLNR